MSSLFLSLVLALLVPIMTQAREPVLPPGNAWRYTLTDGSAFLNDCEICGRPTFLLPMRGTFDLTFNGSSNRYDYYSFTNISFDFTDQNNQTNHISGGGSARIGGDFAFEEVVRWQLIVSNSDTNEAVSMTNSSKGIFSNWPSLQFDLREETKSFFRVYKINLHASPFRELWFSTGSDFSGSGQSISSGDLLSSSGRVIKHDSDILGRMGIQPTIGTTAIDAIDLLPGGEIAFSLSKDIFSETLGPLRQGDLLGSAGRIIKRNSDLMKAFGVDTNIDYGLDACQLMESGEILFSITTNTFSPSLNLNLSRGDILSDQGTIKKTLNELIAPFSPITSSEEAPDVGLDALYVWPGGEIWFSTEEGFDSAQGPISAGDLLSDRGYIVYRNLELAAKFQSNATNEVGLDGIFVITDTAPTIAPGRFAMFKTGTSPGSFELGWNSAAKVFQVERAAVVEGPYSPASEIIPDLFWTDPHLELPNTQNFYRFRQW
jgi:hypothetical protein